MEKEKSRLVSQLTPSDGSMSVQEQFQGAIESAQEWERKYNEAAAEYQAVQGCVMCTQRLAGIDVIRSLSLPLCPPFRGEPRTLTLTPCIVVGG